MMDDKELKRHFSVLTEHLDSKIGLLAEGHASLSESLNRRIDGLEARVHDEGEETRAMIRISYAQLDRRVAALEVEMTGVRERLGRLETHQNS
jgi:hypothetical protein